MKKHALVRIATLPIALEKLLHGQLEFMSTHYDVIAVASEKEKLTVMGQQRNLETFCVPMTRKITPVQDLMAVIRLYVFLRRRKPLFVHSHTPKAGIVGMLAAKFAGVPNRMHTVAGLPLLEARGIKRKLLDIVEMLTYSCATHVYPNSFGLRDIIIANKYCVPEKLRVLGNGSSNGIDTEFFDPALYSFEENDALRTSLGIQREDFVFVFVGRLVADKGIAELVTAFEALQKEQAHIKMLLVGWYEDDLDPLPTATMNSIRTNSGIITTGFRYDVRPYLAISNALVFPSYREGFPNVVMQAGAMGLPCIVTDINGCNEIIVDGRNGIIIPVKDHEAIRQAMRQLLSNPDIAKQLSSHARPDIVSRYEQALLWQALLAEYKSLESSTRV